MRWLLSRQKPDGSFTNLMSTIAVLPTLIGALPFDVQNRSCPTSTTGKHYGVQYILRSERNVGNYHDVQNIPCSEGTTTSLVSQCGRKYRYFLSDRERTSTGSGIFALLGLDIEQMFGPMSL